MVLHEISHHLYTPALVEIVGGHGLEEVKNRV